jgi:hypothetical protein
MGVLNVTNTNRPKEMFRLGMGALFLLSAHSLIAPRAAYSGCSHLVVSQSASFSDLHRFDGLIVTGSSSVLPKERARAPLQDRGQGRRSPCSGPGCSSGVPAPAPPVSYGPDGQNHWGLVDAFTTTQVNVPMQRDCDELVPQATNSKPSIFHPPPL